MYKICCKARGIVVLCYFSKEDSWQCGLACLHDDGVISTKNLGSSSISLRGIKALWLEIQLDVEDCEQTIKSIQANVFYKRVSRTSE